MDPQQCHENVQRKKASESQEIGINKLQIIIWLDEKVHCEEEKKFRKRKRGTEKTVEECVQGFGQFMRKLRFDFLLIREEDSANRRDPLWGTFPQKGATTWTKCHFLSLSVMKKLSQWMMATM